MMYFPDFTERESLSRTVEPLWWGFSVVEVLLSVRLLLELLAVSPASGPLYAIYEVTNYIVLPFAVAFGSSANDGSVLVWTTIAAMLAYFLLTVGVASILKSRRSPHSRIEHARALSRKKYSH